MRWIIGVDEVGRGPLAGPLMVGAIRVPVNFKFQNPNNKLKLRDSKKLTAKAREEWTAYIKNTPEIICAVASVPAEKVDEYGIVRAIRSSADRAIKQALKYIEIHNVEIFCDHGIRPDYPHTELVKGDEMVPVISFASIIAKVTRDAKMVELAKEYPAYGFDAHKGYGTKRHIEAIQKHGLSAVHRKSFCKNFV